MLPASHSADTGVTGAERRCWASLDPGVLLHELTVLQECERANEELGLIALFGLCGTFADRLSSEADFIDPLKAIALLGRCSAFLASAICASWKEDRDSPETLALLGLGGTSEGRP